MFVLSPSVETTAASASSIPARRSTSVSMPCPTTKPPRQSVPSRASASSFSSTAVTSQPSLASCTATADPTRPQPITTAFICRRVDERTRLATPAAPPLPAVERALREGDDQHLAGRVAEDVVDRRGKESRLSTPPRGGAEDDQVSLTGPRFVDDRGTDRPGADHATRDDDPVVLAEQARLLDGHSRALLDLGGKRGVQRELAGNRDDIQGLDGGAALRRDRNRGRHHLLTDLAQLQRHEDVME